MEAFERWDETAMELRCPQTLAQIHIRACYAKLDGMEEAHKALAEGLHEALRQRDEAERLVAALERLLDAERKESRFCSCDDEVSAEVGREVEEAQEAYDQLKRPGNGSEAVLQSERNGAL